MSDIAIAVRNLRNQFGQHVVHEGLDLDVYRGEVLTVVGGSGSGKSVLMRSILGLTQPTAGSIQIYGEDVLRLSATERQRVDRNTGVLFQKGALFSSLNVRENIALPLREHLGMNANDAGDIASLKLALVGLDAQTAETMPQSLSGGMIKRVALARALALDPDILFLVPSESEHFGRSLGTVHQVSH